MERWSFDLDQIRKNWEREADLPSNPLPRKFARVEVPSDPYQEADGLLVRVRALAGAELGAQAAVLAPFFDEAAGLIRGLSPRPEAEKTEGKPPDKEKLRAELARVLGDIEDMLALFSGIGR